MGHWVSPGYDDGTARPRSARFGLSQGRGLAYLGVEREGAGPAACNARRQAGVAPKTRRKGSVQQRWPLDARAVCMRGVDIDNDGPWHCWCNTISLRELVARSQRGGRKWRMQSARRA